MGRGIEPFDRVTVQGLVRQTTAREYKMHALVLGIVHSVPFLQRRGEAVKPSR